MRKLRKEHLQPYLDSLSAIAKCFRRARLVSSSEQFKALGAEAAVKWEELLASEREIRFAILWECAMLPQGSRKKPDYDNWHLLWKSTPSSLLIVESLSLGRDELIRRAIAYDEYWQLPVTLEESIAWHEQRKTQVADKQVEEIQ